MALRWPSKDPDERLDYTIDWSGRLGTDTIVSSAWPEVPDGVTLDAESFGPRSATVWIVGGTLGTTYRLVNRITTVGGRIMDQSVDLPVRSR